MTRRSIVLVGLSGSGKSVVGQELAVRLGTTCTDIDASIEAETGQSVREIFAEGGEDEFRVLERAHVASALAPEPHVIVPGGGWACQPGGLQQAAGALCIHLRVDARTAAARLRGDATRPLLAEGDLVPTLEAQLMARRHCYEVTQHVVDTADRSIKQVVAEVAELAHIHGEW